MHNDWFNTRDFANNLNIALLLGVVSCCLMCGWCMLDEGVWCLVLDVGCWMLDVGCWMLDVGC